MPSKVVIGGAETQRISPTQTGDEENLDSRVCGNDISPTHLGAEQKMVDGVWLMVQVRKIIKEKISAHFPPRIPRIPDGIPGLNSGDAIFISELRGVSSKGIPVHSTM